MRFCLVHWVLESFYNFHGHFSHYLQRFLRCHLEHPFSISAGLANLQHKYHKWRVEFQKLVQMGLLEGHYHLGSFSRRNSIGLSPYDGANICVMNIFHHRFSRGLKTVALYHLSFFASPHRLIHPRLKKDDRVGFW